MRVSGNWEGKGGFRILSNPLSALLSLTPALDPFLSPRRACSRERGLRAEQREWRTWTQRRARHPHHTGPRTRLLLDHSFGSEPCPLSLVRHHFLLPSSILLLSQTQDWFSPCLRLNFRISVVGMTLTCNSLACKRKKSPLRRRGMAGRGRAGMRKRTLEKGLHNMQVDELVSTLVKTLE